MPAKLPSIAAVGFAAALTLLTGAPALVASDHEERASMRLAQLAPTPGPGQTDSMQQSQPDMMGQGMGEGRRMMGRGMMGRGGAMQPRGMRMRGHMMKLMFAIADVDGDGALSFEEVTNIHRRIFNAIDVNKDGRVTPEEFRTFMQSP